MFWSFFQNPVLLRFLCFIKMMSFSPRSHHTYVRFFAFRVPNLGGVFLWKYKCSSPFNALEFLLNLKFSGISHFICIGWKWVLMHLQIIWKSCCFVYNMHLFYTYIYILKIYMCKTIILPGICGQDVHWAGDRSSGWTSEACASSLPESDRIKLVMMNIQILYFLNSKVEQ